VKEKIPAVVHVDGTARIQSVRPETNPMYSRLIGEFGKASSVPILINTSLNINEQPTVNSPLEALHTYFCSGLDVLFLGPFRLSKAN
jgi:carbamoyltransferase